MQHPAIGHDDAKSAVTFREMRTNLIGNADSTRADMGIDLGLAVQATPAKSVCDEFGLAILGGQE